MPPPPKGPSEQLRSKEELRSLAETLERRLIGAVAEGAVLGEALAHLPSSRSAELLALSTRLDAGSFIIVSGIVSSIPEPIRLFVYV